MKAKCTWGEGADVLVIIDKPLLLMEHPDTTRTKHGIVKHAQLDLTADEARSLGNSILAATNKADRLTHSYTDYIKSEEVK